MKQSNVKMHLDPAELTKGIETQTTEALPKKVVKSASKTPKAAKAAVAIRFLNVLLAQYRETTFDLNKTDKKYGRWADKFLDEQYDQLLADNEDLSKILHQMDTDGELDGSLCIH